jgi:hypothetical protein
VRPLLYRPAYRDDKPHGTFSPTGASDPDQEHQPTRGAHHMSKGMDRKKETKKKPAKTKEEKKAAKKAKK